MTTNVPTPDSELARSPAVTPPQAVDERLKAIEVIGQRINTLVRFMCEIDSLPGTSGEAKERAIAAFHDRLAAAEKQLSRVHDHLRLG